MFHAIKIGKINDLLKSVWIEVLLQYDVVWVHNRVLFREKELVEDEIDPYIWNMKNFIYGFYRFDDIYSYKLNEDGKKTDTPYKESISEDYYDGNPNKSMQGIDYFYK